MNPKAALFHYVIIRQTREHVQDFDISFESLIRTVSYGSCMDRLTALQIILATIEV